MSSLTGSSSSSSDGSPAKLRDDGLRVPDIYLIEGLKNMSPNWFIGSSSYIESVSLELEKLREELSIRSSSSSLPDHKRPRREEETFDFEDADMCGLVFGLGDSLVRVDLMTFKSDESQIQPTSVFVFAPKGFRTDFSVGWSFAVVKSKLFATGGQAKCYFSTPDYPRETSALDGETDLKTRGISSACAGIDSELLHKIKGVIECPNPDKDIRRCLFPPFIDADVCPFTINNTVLQSCYLRNTEWVCGVAVYAGNETKLGMSRGIPEPKLTAMDAMIDKLTGAIFVFQIVVVVVLGIAGNVWKDTEARKYQMLVIYIDHMLLERKQVGEKVCKLVLFGYV